MANSNPFWDEVKRIGWLNYVPQSQHEELFRQIEQNLEGDDPGLTWMALVQGTFEPGSDPIDEVVAMLKDISNGKFVPTNIQIEPRPRDNLIAVSFDHAGKRFSEVLADESDLDWFTSLLGLANTAVESTGINERFIQLPAVDFVNLVFVSPTVHEAAVKAKLLPADDMMPED
jgi:hypothetical protein